MTHSESPPSLVTINSQSGHHRIPVYQWLAKKSPKAVLHISHGMAEHSARYQELAEQLTRRGFHVYAHDHRGHGATINKDKTSSQGHFGDHDGWNNVVQDLKRVVDHTLAQHPTLPCFLLGHSMGSSILQSYLGRHNPNISGAILSGSNLVAKPLLMLARLVAKIETLRQGVMGHSPVIHQLTFAGYNNRFKPNTTEFDWLSRNPESVMRYVKDPLCGFRCSNQLWHDLFGGAAGNQFNKPVKENQPSAASADHRGRPRPCQRTGWLKKPANGMDQFWAQQYNIDTIPRCQTRIISSNQPSGSD
ncbi:alpha/beta hydrolase [Endozoicomonas sp. ALB115]|uniref:alpha/beta hydrolase n=1 Tax=Endozoicomonas sp. ALB115 TaxID=3403074 RepID=UPI003BB6BE2B